MATIMSLHNHLQKVITAAPTANKSHNYYNLRRNFNSPYNSYNPFSKWHTY